MVFLHDPTSGGARPRDSSLRAFVGPILALLGALLGPLGCRGRQAPPPPPVAVKLLTVAQTPTESRLVYSGTVKAQTQVDLAFKVGGYVQTVGATGGHAERDASFARAAAKSPLSRRLLQAGDQVARGTLLAALRESDFKQRYSELAGMSAEARASLQKATLDYERAQTLFSQNAISKAEFDAAKTRYHAIAGKGRLSASPTPSCGRPSTG
jgi:multidrug efflux pump subunit AcrA (membrane-fusion protein)